MTSAEEHIRKIKEHIEEIDEAIELGIEKRPVTIGFHCSACSIQLLELYLHVINKISIGKVVKHEWFKKPKTGQKQEPLIERNLSTDFPLKENIYSLNYEIEERRNTLVYGKSTREQIKSILNSFNKLKDVLIEELKKNGIEI